MLNLLDLTKRYGNLGMGYIRFGGHSFYKINSDEPLELNSRGGSDGYILNSDGEVEIFKISDDRSYDIYYKGKKITSEEYDNMELDEVIDDIKIVDNSTIKYFDETLDKYYPHPWYPEKEIVSFQVVNISPFLKKDQILNIENGTINIQNDSNEISYTITVEDCLKSPEFFKPLYNE